MKEEGDVMEGHCRDITTKINRTATTISQSMTNLNQLVETKRSDTRIITEDVKLLKIEMENHHSSLEHELEENQMKINKELQMINQKLLEAIEQSKQDAAKSKKCIIQ